MRTKCEECNGKIIKKNVPFSLYTVHLGSFPAEVCAQCGEECFDEEASEMIDDAAKTKGLWGLSARAKVGVAGDSLIIRINKRMAKFLDLKKGAEVQMHPESKNKLVIEI